MSATLTWSEIKNRLTPWSRVNMGRDNIHLVTDQAVLDVVNLVAADLNREAEIHIERYYQKTTAGVTNYELAGEIFRVFLFTYGSRGASDPSNAYTSYPSGEQFYSYVQDVIVLQTAPASEVQMDIRYQRNTVDIENEDSSEIDLPGYALTDFLELVKVKLLEDYGGQDYRATYQPELLARAGRLVEQKPRTALFDKQVFRSTFKMNDDHKYDITDNWVSQDSVVVGAGGTYYII